jgi:uncharacterized protein YxjI
MRYLVRERIFSITNDFWVTDEQGNDVFLVDGKALSLRETFELKDVSGLTLATIHKRFLTFTDTMEIEHDGAVVARPSLVSPGRGSGSATPTASRSLQAKTTP